MPYERFSSSGSEVTAFKEHDLIIIASGNDANWRAVAYQRKSFTPFHYFYYAIPSLYELLHRWREGA